MASVSAVHAGLSSTPKRLDNHTLMYDARGSLLFNKASQQPEYYIYRNDLAVIKDNAKEIAQLVGKGVTLVDIGCGMCQKTMYLLEALEDLMCFVAVDIESDVLKKVKEKLKIKHPELKVVTLVADFMQRIAIPEDGNKKLGLMAGSTIAVYSDEDVGLIVKNALESLGDDCVLLMSFDTNQDPKTTSDQYTKTGFSDLVLNALSVMNKQLQANFDPDAFLYECHWHGEDKRVDHCLVAQSKQTVTLDGRTYLFEKNEPLRVYYGKKRTVEDFSKIVRSVGGVVKRTFFDEQKFICLAWIEKTKL